MSFFLSYQRQFAVTWQDLAYYKYEGKREKHIPFRWSQDKPLPAATWIKHTWITHLFTSSKGFCTWPVDVQVLILIVCYALILSCWLDILSELSFYNHRTTSFKKHTRQVWGPPTRFAFNLPLMRRHQEINKLGSASAIYKIETTSKKSFNFFLSAFMTSSFCHY